MRKIYVKRIDTYNLINCSTTSNNYYSSKYHPDYGRSSLHCKEYRQLPLYHYYSILYFFTNLTDTFTISETTFYHQQRDTKEFTAELDWIFYLCINTLGTAI